MVDPIRGAPLSASSLGYFRSLHSSLQAAADSGSDVGLMVAAAYGELKGLEYRLLVNKHGSRCMESLIAHSTPSQLAGLLAGTQNAAFALLIDRNASHAMQRLIERLPKLLQDEQRAGAHHGSDSLSASLLSFCQSLSDVPTSEQSATVTQLSSPPSSCWPLLLLHEQGSFAVRSLARLMSGAADIATQQDKDRLHRGANSASGAQAGSASAGVATSAPASLTHVSFLAPVLAALVDSVVALPSADVVELAFHATAAPALSEVLRALSAHSKYHSLLESLILALLLTEAQSASEDVSVSSRGVSHAGQLMRHRVGSHLFHCSLTPSGGTGMLDKEQIALPLVGPAKSGTPFCRYLFLDLQLQSAIETICSSVAHALE